MLGGESDALPVPYPMESSIAPHCFKADTGIKCVQGGWPLAKCNLPTVYLNIKLSTVSTERKLCVCFSLYGCPRRISVEKTKDGK